RRHDRFDLVLGDVAALLGGADELPDGPVRYAQQRALRQGLGTLYLQHLFLLRRLLGLACHEPPQPALGPRRIASSRVADSLKRRRRLRKNFICRRIFRFRTQTRRKSLSFRGRDVFSVQSPASKRRSSHQLNVLSRKTRPCAGSRRSFVIFSNSELEERIHLPQVTAAQELQIKAQTRLAALMEEKLVTRISVLSTLLGGGKTTERLLVRISIETHKTSPDFDPGCPRFC